MHAGTDHSILLAHTEQCAWLPHKPPTQPGLRGLKPSFSVSFTNLPSQPSTGNHTLFRTLAPLRVPASFCWWCCSDLKSKQNRTLLVPILINYYSDGYSIESDIGCLVSTLYPGNFSPNVRTSSADILAFKCLYNQMNLSLSPLPPPSLYIYQSCQLLFNQCDTDGQTMRSVTMKYNMSLSHLRINICISKQKYHYQ